MKSPKKRPLRYLAGESDWLVRFLNRRTPASVGMERLILDDERFHEFVVVRDNPLRICIEGALGLKGEVLNRKLSKWISSFEREQQNDLIAAFRISFDIWDQLGFEHLRQCVYCRRWFVAKRMDQKHCSTAHRRSAFSSTVAGRAARAKYMRERYRPTQKRLDKIAVNGVKCAPR
jgi:hypothetical protein